MLEINVKLWRNYQQNDWSAEINGSRYEGVAIEFVEELVERALITAEADLTESASRKPN